MDQSREKSPLATVLQRWVGGISAKRGLIRTWGVVLSATVAVLVVACSAAAPAEETSAVTTQPAGGPEFSAVVVTSDLAVGPNRVSFGLIDREGMPVRTDEAQVQSVYFPPGENTGQIKQAATAHFREWPPTGSRGVFVTSLDFDVPGEATQAAPGLWALQITTVTREGVKVQAQTALRVAADSSTPAIGQPAPASKTPTSRDTDDLSTISSSPDPDPDLYRLSIDEALAQGKPLVLTFATPAFCVSATCGPQVEMLSQVKERHQGEANFIHVEVFKDPHLIQGGRPTGGWVPAVEEWGLLSEPWTFVIDSGGLVRAKFEQFVPADEIEEALLEVL